MNLKNLIVDSRVVDVDFPGLEGFSVQLAYMSKERMYKLRDKCMVTKFDRKSHVVTPEMDMELFNKLFTEAVIKGWKGFKYKYLEDFILIDSENINLEDELPFSVENALLIMQNSKSFDTWIGEVINDLDTFRTRPAVLALAAP